MIRTQSQLIPSFVTLKRIPSLTGDTQQRAWQVTFFQKIMKQHGFLASANPHTLPGFFVNVLLTLDRIGEFIKQAEEVTVVELTGQPATSETDGLLSESKEQENLSGSEDSQQALNIKYSIFYICSNFRAELAVVEQLNPTFDMEKIKKGLRQLVEDTGFQEYLMDRVQAEDSAVGLQGRRQVNRTYNAIKLCIENLYSDKYRKGQINDKRLSDFFGEIQQGKRKGLEEQDIREILLTVLNEVLKGVTQILCKIVPGRLLSMLNYELHIGTSEYQNSVEGFYLHFQGMLDSKRLVCQAIDGNNLESCLKLQRLIDAMVEDFDTMVEQHRELLHASIETKLVNLKSLVAGFRRVSKSLGDKRQSLSDENEQIERAHSSPKLFSNRSEQEGSGSELESVSQPAP